MSGPENRLVSGPDTFVFPPLDEIERAIQERIRSIDLTCIVRDVIDRKRGRVSAREPAPAGSAL